MGNKPSRKGLQRSKTIVRPMSKDALVDLKKYYKLESTALGRGAFGKVFKGESLTDSNFLVAIKMLNK